jgi:hypothetical protein
MLALELGASQTWMLLTWCPMWGEDKIRLKNRFNEIFGVEKWPV